MPSNGIAASIAKKSSKSPKPSNPSKPSKPSKSSKSSKPSKPSKPKPKAKAKGSSGGRRARKQEAELDDAQDDEHEEETSEKAEVRERKRRRKAKLTGYRSLAREAGYVAEEGGMDATALLVSDADSRRLLTFIPAMPAHTSFGLSEFKKRFQVSRNAYTGGALRETAANVDAALRASMNAAVLRTVEAGGQRVSAATMKSVLRRYSGSMLFSAVEPPLGLIRHAQKKQLLETTDEDVAMRPEERKEGAKGGKLVFDHEKAVQEKKILRRNRLLAKRAEAGVDIASA